MSNDNSKRNNFEEFLSKDFGLSQPSSVQTETIHVQIGTDDLIADFGKAFVTECYRVHPLRAEQLAPTEEEMDKYCRYLVFKRIECVHNQCRDFRLLKQLWMPAFIQYNLAMIGRLPYREKGIEIMPEAADQEVISFEEASKISRKIEMFKDVLQVVTDAMPRSPYGNKDVMLTAMIAGYVRSIDPLDHVAGTIVSRFLGFKIREEAAFQSLYRVQYDDCSFIASALLMRSDIF